VCIPTFEQPQLFHRALTTVLKQDFEDFEVVVTDDSASADIEAIVVEAADSRIRYERNERRLGSPGNWNRGLDFARGELIKVLHHDDWLLSPTALSRFVSAFDDQASAHLAFSVSTANSEGEIVSTHRPTDRLEGMRTDPRGLLLGNWIGGPSATMFRAGRTRRFDPQFRWVVDIDFYLSILMRRPEFSHIDTPLVATTTAASHQVTSAVQGTDVELSEWFRLYAKWAPYPAVWGERAEFLTNLLARFSGTTWRDHRRLSLAGRSARILFATDMLRRAELSYSSFRLRKPRGL
jgi:glycosyltransferase involved in cell wall biosynthesis